MSRVLGVATFVLAALTAFSVGASAVGYAASLNLTSQNFTPYRTCTITATPSGATAVIDASVRQGSATSNFGTDTTMDVATTNVANRRIYIKFLLTGCAPSIPSSATIRRATVRLYVSTLPAACRTLDIFRVTAAWTEAAVTWNNQPFGTTVNNPASGSRTDSIDIGTPAACANNAVGYVTGADVTSDVSAFVSGSATNDGWMIRDDTEGSSPPRTTTFSAKNLGTLGQAPQLVVTYVTTP